MNKIAALQYGLIRIAAENPEVVQALYPLIRQAKKIKLTEAQRKKSKKKPGGFVWKYLDEKGGGAADTKYPSDAVKAIVDWAESKLEPLRERLKALQEKHKARKEAGKSTKGIRRQRAAVERKMRHFNKIKRDANKKSGRPAYWGIGRQPKSPERRKVYNILKNQRQINFGKFSKKYKSMTDKQKAKLVHKAMRNSKGKHKKWLRGMYRRLINTAGNDGGGFSKMASSEFHERCAALVFRYLF